MIKKIFSKIKVKVFPLLIFIFCFSGLLYTAFVLQEMSLSAEESFQKGIQAYRKKNYKKASSYLTTALFDDIPEAGLVLGEMALNGKGEHPDPAKAALMYEKAANLGDKDAQYSLALLYDKGLGVPLDKGKALQWAMKAASNNNRDAMFASAVWIERGYNPLFTLKDARYFYERAASLGDINAIQSLIAIYSRGVGLDGPDEQRAQFWLLMLNKIVGQIHQAQSEGVFFDTPHVPVMQELSFEKTQAIREKENLSDSVGKKLNTDTNESPFEKESEKEGK
jgi:hypothetical protein